MSAIGGKADMDQDGPNVALLTLKRHASARKNGRWNEVGPAGESLQECDEVRFFHVTQAKWIYFGCSTCTINAASIVKVYYR